MNSKSLLDEVIKEVIPYGLFYSIQPRIDTSLAKTKDELLRIFSFIITVNDNDFIKKIEGLNDQMFLRELNAHYTAYNTKCKDMTDWLNHTSKLIKSMPNNIYLMPIFKEWQKTKIHEVKKNLIKKSDKEYSLKEVAIACFAMGITLTNDNYKEYVTKYCPNKDGAKIVQKRINRTTDLTNITENKSADSKHLKALMGAKRLLSGIDNRKAIKELDHYIQAFQVNFDNHYN
jgi:hypothetical protein